MSEAKRILNEIAGVNEADFDAEDMNLLKQRSSGLTCRQFVYVDSENLIDLEVDPDSDEGLQIAGNSLLMWVDSEGMSGDVTWDRMYYYGLNSEGEHQYYTVMRFDSQEALNRWLAVRGKDKDEHWIGDGNK